MAGAGKNRTGPVTLDYYGHCAFVWTTPQGVRALVDPYRNQPENPWFFREFPPIEADVVLSTHRHFDHSAVDRVTGLPTVLRGPGEFSLGDLRVTGILDTHTKRQGREPLDNVVFIVEVAGVRFCHWGDNRSCVPSGTREAIGRVDVLMVNVDDSRHSLEYEEVGALIETLRPLVVIPMHYLVPGLTMDASTLLSPEEWLNGQDQVRRVDGGQVSISADVLPKQRETWLFDLRPGMLKTA